MVSNQQMPRGLRTLATVLLVAACGGVTRAQPAADPLRLALACERASEVTFRFTLQNVSTAPTAAVIGTILANDKKYLPERLGLTVRRSGVPDTYLEYVDTSMLGVIGGRLDPWLIALPAGASYSVVIPAHFALSPTSVRESFSSPAELRLHLMTREIGNPNFDVQGLRVIHVWVGTITSDWIHFPDACSR
jgi:hypothetical protein